jgi:hypothetical protein
MEARGQHCLRDTTAPSGFGLGVPLALPSTVALMTEGIFALAGVTVGALLNALRDRSIRRASRFEARRLEALDMVIGFLRDVDTVWRGAQRLTYAVAIMMADQSSRHGVEEREAALDELHPALRDARLQIGRMRLLAPHLVDPAVTLVAASEDFNLERSDALNTARNAAMRTFEEAARPMVQ